MIKTDEVVQLLKKTGPLKFQQIWEELKDKLSAEVLNIEDDSQLISDLLISMSKDERLVIIAKDGKDDWDLRENYSYEEFKNIKSKALDAELKKIEKDALEEEDVDKTDNDNDILEE